MTFKLPIVIKDLDKRIADIEQEIRDAAMAYQFYYVVSVDPYLPNEQIPDVVYELQKHFMKRGFFCIYNGDVGALKIAWDRPNMTDLDVVNITYARHAKIATLGGGFTAPMVYLCMTNGHDIRRHSDVTLRRQLTSAIEKAAVEGKKSIAFTFPGVPSLAIASLFRSVFEELNNSGYGVRHSASMDTFVVAWDDGNDVELFDGATKAIDLS